MVKITTKKGIVIVLNPENSNKSKEYTSKHK